MLRRIAIVGASLAGLRAAETLRDRGFDGELTLIGDEPHRPYDRPPLSKQVLQGVWEPEQTFFRKKDGYDALALDMRLGPLAEGAGRGAEIEQRRDVVPGEEEQRIFAAVVRPERRRDDGDVEAERARLEREIARAEGMLANERFVAKAPADVVAAEREKLERYRRELAILTDGENG